MNAMEPTAHAAEQDPRAEGRVVLYGVSWQQYEAILAALGDNAGARLAYYRGALEIMSPSAWHELTKKNIARLLEVYAMEMDLELVGYGSTTFRKKAKERGVEPDECYVMEPPRGEPVTADLAIEVVLSSWKIDKLAVYAGLGVRELWLVKSDHLEIHVLRKNSYRRAKRSRLLPDLDIGMLLRFVYRPDQTAAAREFQALLRRA
jgi:Uma2 family endonuclease